MTSKDDAPKVNRLNWAHKEKYPKFEKIEIGISSGNKTSIIEGLRPGEQIFIDIPPWANKRK